MTSPYPPEVWQRAGLIKLVILDVDGVLTDGRLYFDKAGEKTYDRSFENYLKRKG